MKSLFERVIIVLHSPIKLETVPKRFQRMRKNKILTLTVCINGLARDISKSRVKTSDVKQLMKEQAIRMCCSLSSQSTIGGDRFKNNSIFLKFWLHRNEIKTSFKRVKLYKKRRVVGKEALIIKKN